MLERDRERERERESESERERQRQRQRKRMMMRNIEIKRKRKRRGKRKRTSKNRKRNIMISVYIWICGACNLREFVRANSRHPGSSARGGGSGPPRRVPDSGATGATVTSGATVTAPSGSHFRAPLSRMRPFAVTAAGQKCLRVLIFEHPCGGCGASLWWQIKK